MEKNQIVPRKSALLLGILGCVLMGASDWLMIYGDTAFEGSLPWLTAGVAQIPPQRNSLALFLAFPAIVFYGVGLFGVKPLLRKGQKTYGALTVLGLTPWIALHLFYVMIFFLFGWMSRQGQAPLAHAACEALFAQFQWMIPLAEVFMVLPYLHLFFVFIAGQSLFSRWMALNNPLLIFAVLKSLTRLLPDLPARLAFTNGLMSESMAVWFFIYIFGLCKYSQNEKSHG